MALAIPPSLNDTFVVAIELVMGLVLPEPGESPNKQLEAHCPGPANVSFTIDSLPAWNEMPSTPAPSNDNANSNS